ncbi:MAG: hypothetical protein A2Z95_06115 [Gallionellales bacterium GWA2_60_18]|nr:MAG: hypothetical protein A2Z95_06115 [Gallionellales bacterium GWA2_60_18]
MTSITPDTLTVTPVNLLEIVEIIGEAAALLLVKEFGGQTVRLPAIRNINAEHPLALCIGIAALGAICRDTGGGRWLYIAKCQRGLLADRNRRIVEEYSGGDTANALAQRYRLSDRQIWNILGSYVDDRQVSLF